MSKRMLKRYRINVYRVVSMFEFDTMAKSAAEAEKAGLNEVVKPGVSGFTRPDCKFIAMIQREKR